MESSIANKPLPPGSPGWPVLGETLPFLKNGFDFVDSRMAKHGPVFRTRILGRDAVVLVGPEGTAAFNDEERVQRAGGMPKFVEEFFGGKSLPLLDFDVHRARKSQVMAAFSRAALESYVPTMQACVERALRAYADKGEVRAASELKRLAVEVITRTMTSVEPGPEMETVLQGFQVLSEGFGALPVAIPGTAFARALAGRDRIFEVLKKAVADHRAKHFDDGLGRVLAARAPDGSQISDEHAMLELHHFNIAGYLVFTHFALTLVQLSQDQALAARLREEIGKAPRALDLASIAKMDLLDRFAKEVKRVTPFVPIFFGQARRDFELGGYRIPEGWMVLWSHHGSSFFEESFADAKRFDPDRFAPPRAEDEKHPCAYAPQGTGVPEKGHKCAGFDYATIFMKVFACVALRGFDWTLPEQDLSYRYDMVPPEHASGLRVRFTAR